MRYLGLALFAEGPTDHEFLSPILLRSVTDLCRKEAIEEVDVGPVLELHSPSNPRDRSRAGRVHEAAQQAAWGFHILFIHSDGESNPQEVHRERVQPAMKRVGEDDAGDHCRTVAVVPVRETEAWAMADGNALRGAFGAVLDDASLGVPPRPQDVEKIPDPKQVLAQAYTAVVGSRRLKAGKHVHLLEAIARRVDLVRVRQVPAFRRVERDLRNALRDLGYLRASGRGR